MADGLGGVPRPCWLQASTRDLALVHQQLFCPSWADTQVFRRSAAMSLPGDSFSFGDAITGTSAAGRAPGQRNAVAGAAFPSGLSRADWPELEERGINPLPLTVGAVAATCVPNEAVWTGLRHALGADLETPFEDFLAIPEADFTEALGAMMVDGNAASAVQRGSAVRLLRQLFKQGNVSPPSFGAARPSPKGLPAPPEPAGNLDTAAGGKRKFSDVADQAGEGSFTLLPKEEVKAARQRYKNIMGGQPQDDPARPTAEQLSVVAALLRIGVSLFLDFAIFGPYGKRLAKQRKFQDQVFINGRLETRMLSGPANFESWLACWSVFKSCMLALGAASPGALDGYSNGIRQLSTLWPNYWGVILTADEVMRGEQWEQCAEDILEESGDEQHVWDKVLQDTRFGNARGSGAHWWWTHVVAPCQKSLPSGTAPLIAQLEGAASQQPPPAQPWTAPRAPRTRPTGAERRAAAAGKASQQAPAGAQTGAPASGSSSNTKGKGRGKPKNQEPCRNWSMHLNGCHVVCPYGRAHVCHLCGGAHRAASKQC